MLDGVFQLTKLGKAEARLPGTSRNDVLDMLYSSPNRTSSLASLEASTGIQKPRLMSELRRLESRGLVREIKEARI